jgi:hypothetical protein
VSSDVRRLYPSKRCNALGYGRNTPVLRLSECDLQQKARYAPMTMDEPKKMNTTVASVAWTQRTIARLVLGLLIALPGRCELTLCGNWTIHIDYNRTARQASVHARPVHPRHYCQDKISSSNSDGSSDRRGRVAPRGYPPRCEPQNIHRCRTTRTGWGVSPEGICPHAAVPRNRQQLNSSQRFLPRSIWAHAGRGVGCRSLRAHFEFDAAGRCVRCLRLCRPTGSGTCPH